jgi:hypothetical protein
MSSCAFVVLTAKIKRWKKAYIAIALVIAGLLSYRALNVAYGHPSVLQNDYGDVWVLGYHADTDNDTVYLWIRGHDDEAPTSYKMPYSIKLHKRLELNRSKHRGTPYRSKIKSQNSPFKRFTNTVDEVEVEPIIGFPQKSDKK